LTASSGVPAELLLRCAAMVQLTRQAAARLTPVLGKADDIRGARRYGRKNIQDKDVPFKEVLPLSLKNIVSNQSTKGKEKACMKEMMEVVACMGKFDQNESMCEKEIQSFKTCFKTFKVRQAEAKTLRESGDLPIGPRAKFTGPQLTQYMKQFKQSTRTGEMNSDQTYANHWATKR